MDADHARDIRRLFITWEEVFQKSRIDFYILKSTLLRYLESGELIFADILCRMSPAQRLEHLEAVKERLLGNPNIRFHLLDDDALPAEDLPGLAAYLNPKKLFLKNPSAYLTGRGPLFYTVQSEVLIQAARGFLESLGTLPGSGTYDQRDLAELEGRYGGMLYRMLTLQEEP